MPKISEAKRQVREHKREKTRANSGEGPVFQALDIGHTAYAALIEPETAFWTLVKKERLANAFSGEILAGFLKRKAALEKEIQTLRFGLRPSAVYFNPTERCNLNCSYCYIPEKQRLDGRTMKAGDLLRALAILKEYFGKNLPKKVRPQIVFHGSEPLLNRDAMFAGMDAYRNDFFFGLQTNATLLDDEAISFLKERHVAIGVSLDGSRASFADKARKTWDGKGVFRRVISALDRLSGYDRFSVICTASSMNLSNLAGVVGLLHEKKVPACLINQIRCTQDGAMAIKPGDGAMARALIAALDRSHALYKKTGRKIVVSNFANILLAIVAPTARKLMCDINPCGGGRCFFAVSADGDCFPCSEFVGLPEFKGGNLFRKPVAEILKSGAFARVTGRRVEGIEDCRVCAIRHFCGAPCPAEAVTQNGGLDRKGAFCEFYEEQVRYAFRVIADGKLDDFLYDGWREETRDSLV